jgi:hypothetical protein
MKKILLQNWKKDQNAIIKLSISLTIILFNLIYIYFLLIWYIKIWFFFNLPVFLINYKPILK